MPTRAASRKTLESWESAVAFRFLVAPLGFLMVVSIYPFLFAIWTSLQNYFLFSPESARFVGLQNYASMLTALRFWDSLGRTLVFAGVSLVLQVVIGFALAFLLDSDRRFFGTLRSLLVAPVLMTPVVVALMWFYIFDPNIGVLNYLATAVHLPAHPWLSDPATAMGAVIAVNVWEWTPFAFLVFAAGLRSISPEIREAAQLDGAGHTQMARYIFIPLLRPVLVVIVLLLAIDNLKSFDVIYVMTRGGPGLATYTLPIKVWTDAFASYQMGTASATALVLVAIINIMLVALNRLMSGEQLGTPKGIAPAGAAQP